MHHIHVVKVSGITRHLIACLFENGITMDEFARRQGDYIVFLAANIFDNWYMTADEVLTKYKDANMNAQIQTLFVDA